MAILHRDAIDMVSKLLSGIKFVMVVIWRALVVLFRSRRGIEQLRLEYLNEHLFDISYIILQYRFRNALWYRFGKHNTLEKEIKIFNLTNFDREFDLIVYGLFRKKTYHLKFEPTLTLENKYFKTELQNKSVELTRQSNLAFPEFTWVLSLPTIQLGTVEFNAKKITIQNNAYNQTDFI